MDIDVNKIKDMAAGAASELDKNKQAKDAVDGVINKVEEKVKTDLPSADDIIKVVKN
ncbi:MAG: hypothetical protein IKE53_10140 [Clostridiales bacterium]|nr:hypothetical protein [Clostridiales bacterium]